MRVGFCTAIAIVLGVACAKSPPASEPAPTGDRKIAQRLGPGQLDAVVKRHQDRLADCLFSCNAVSAAVEFTVVGNGRVSRVVVNGTTQGRLARCVHDVMSQLQFPRSVTLQTQGQFEMSR
jgi:hypothetical protein